MNNTDTRKELMMKSLTGLWVGDCIGNIGQLYFAHDILKALDEGIMKFGQETIDGISPNRNLFQYSDDTEEAIVLVNHLYNNEYVDQDKLAKEFAKRYYERDPDGEIFGYGLMTRKVLRDIYEGKDWREANQTKPRVEGPSFVDNLLGEIASGKSINDAMAETNAALKEKMKNEPNLLVGSCGNGSAMRVAPLGAFFSGTSVAYIRAVARFQSQVTHCHPEGEAGAMAVALMAAFFARMQKQNWKDIKSYNWFDIILDPLPDSAVRDGIKKAKEIPFDTPFMKVVELIGNGTHVTAQDTVPLCIWLSIRALNLYEKEEMYEKVIIDTCKCFGDVDTTCAIVGGIVGVYSPPPDKWVRYCQPMEGVLDDPLPVKPKKHRYEDIPRMIDETKTLLDEMKSDPNMKKLEIGTSREEHNGNVYDGLINTSDKKQTYIDWDKVHKNAQSVINERMKKYDKH